MQAWLGTWQQTQVEGQQVLLFTAQDSTLPDVPAGTQYVLFSPPLATGGPDVHGGVGRPGDTVLYEGLVVPGQQFGGYPVIHIYSGAIENVRQNLDGYATATPEPDMPGTNTAPSLPQGEVIIDSIELVYYHDGHARRPAQPERPAHLRAARLALRRSLRRWDEARDLGAGAEGGILKLNTQKQDGQDMQDL